MKRDFPEPTIINPVQENKQEPKEFLEPKRKIPKNIVQYDHRGEIIYPIRINSSLSI
jgi:hypothetical protein